MAIEAVIVELQRVVGNVICDHSRVLSAVYFAISGDGKGDSFVKLQASGRGAKAFE